MAEYNIDPGTLPLDVRAKLAELDLELSEGKQDKFSYKKSRDLIKD